MRKISVLCLLITMLIGCMPKVEISRSVNYLRLAEVEVKTIENPIYDTIKIKSVQGVDYIFTRDFIYSDGKGVYNKYAFHRWQEPVSKQFEHMLFVAIRKSNLFKNVLSKNSEAHYRYLLETEVLKFEQIISDNISKVIVEINVNLIDAKTDNIVSSKIFKSASNVAQIDAKGALEGYNKAVELVINEMVEWLKVKAE